MRWWATRRNRGGDARGVLRASWWRSRAFGMTVNTLVRESGTRISGRGKLASLVSLSGRWRYPFSSRGRPRSAVWWCFSLRSKWWSRSRHGRFRVATRSGEGWPGACISSRRICPRWGPWSSSVAASIPTPVYGASWTSSICCWSIRVSTRRWSASSSRRRSIATIVVWSRWLIAFRWSICLSTKRAGILIPGADNASESNFLENSLVSVESGQRVR